MAECSPDYPVAGMQAGEELATLLRRVALMVSISVMFPWLSSERRSRMRVFFLHWLSGVVYVICQCILSIMVLNCWSSKRVAGPFILFVKFMELSSLNLWSISSLAIAFLIASIVQAFAKCRRVPSKIGSALAAYSCVALAVAATVVSAAFWNSLIMTGGYFWVTNTDSELVGHWISLSFGAVQMVAGFLMAVTVLFTVSGERLESLKAACQTSNRVKFHFILTLFGTCVNIYNGVTLLIDELADAEISRRLVVIGWCSRYVHIIADTGIIFGTFYALENVERTGSRTQGYTDVRTGTEGAPALLPRPALTAAASAPTKRAGASTPASTAQEDDFGSIEGQGTPALEQQKNDATTGPVNSANENSSRPATEEIHGGGQKSPPSSVSSNKPRVKLHAASSVACTG